MASTTATAHEKKWRYNNLPYPEEPDLRKLLINVSGTKNLSSVQSLRLRVIAREVSLQRIHLFTPYLQELRLDGSRVSSLRDLGCGLRNLKVLRVAYCGLRCLDGLNGLTSLEELYADNNDIDDVGPCTSLINIRIISLRNNAVTDVTYVGFLILCTELKHLVLEGNPCSSMELYRETVKECMPTLYSLDGIYYSDCEDEDCNLDEIMEDTYESPRVPDAIEEPPPIVDNQSSGDTAEVQIRSIRSDDPVDQTPECARPQRMRPATATGVFDLEPHFTARQMLRPRPVTCHPTSAHDAGVDDEVILAHAFQNICSLTPGEPLCGNLATALRNRKPRHIAWADPVKARINKSRMEEIEKAFSGPSWLDSCTIETPKVDIDLGVISIGDGPIMVNPGDVEIDNVVLSSGESCLPSNDRRERAYRSYIEIQTKEQIRQKIKDETIKPLKIRPPGDYVRINAGTSTGNADVSRSAVGFPKSIEGRKNMWAPTKSDTGVAAVRPILKLKKP